MQVGERVVTEQLQLMQEVGAHLLSTDPACHSLAVWHEC